MVVDAEQKSVIDGLKSTPPLPEDLPGVDLSPNAQEVFTRRYVRKGKTGNLLRLKKKLFGEWLIILPGKRNNGVTMF